MKWFEGRKKWHVAAEASLVGWLFAMLIFWLFLSDLESAHALPESLELLMFSPVFIAVIISGLLVSKPMDLIPIVIAFVGSGQVVQTIVAGIWGDPITHDINISDLDFWIGSLLLGCFWSALIAFVSGSRWVVRKFCGV